MAARAPDVPGHRMLFPSMNHPFAPPLLPPLEILRSHLLMEELLGDLLYQSAVAIEQNHSQNLVVAGNN